MRMTTLFIGPNMGPVIHDVNRCLCGIGEVGSCVGDDLVTMVDRELPKGYVPADCTRTFLEIAKKHHLAFMHDEYDEFVFERREPVEVIQAPPVITIQ